MNGRDYSFPIEAHATPRQTNHRNALIGDQALDASARQVETLSNFVFRQQVVGYFARRHNTTVCQIINNATIYFGGQKIKSNERAEGATLPMLSWSN
jgi:hypothetical protein